MAGPPDGMWPRKGVWLIDLTLVVVIIGVLGAVGIPHLLTNVERTKANEAFQWLSAHRASQERYHSSTGHYADDLSGLDVRMPEPTYFTVGPVRPGSTGRLEGSWLLTLTRKGLAAGYGAYTVTFTDRGYDPNNSTLDPAIDPTGR